MGKKPLIQDLDEPEPQAEIQDTATVSDVSNDSMPAPVAPNNTGKKKKGKPLYEKGSDEGKAEHPWNKLMGRSKVVDMNDMTPEQQQAYAKDGTVPKNIGKGPNDKPVKKRTDFADAEFEELMQIADPDYGLEAKQKRQA